MCKMQKCAVVIEIVYTQYNLNSTESSTESHMESISYFPTINLVTMVIMLFMKQTTSQILGYCDLIGSTTIVVDCSSTSSHHTFLYNVKGQVLPDYIDIE